MKVAESNSRLTPRRITRAFTGTSSLGRLSGLGDSGQLLVVGAATQPDL
jgi:hypothetical protein